MPKFPGTQHTVRCHTPSRGTQPLHPTPSLGHTTVFPLALVRGHWLGGDWGGGLCPEGLQPQGPVNHGAGIIYRADEAQSCHCLKPTRDSVPSY